MTPRDIEKLKAIGYGLDEHPNPLTEGYCPNYVCFGVPFPHQAWDAAKAHSQSPEGMKATMADKVRWLGGVELWRDLHPTTKAIVWNAESKERVLGDVRARHEHSDSPEAAVDALFWKVP